MKIERLLRLAEAGVTFFMFDFLSYVRPGVDRALQHRASGLRLLETPSTATSAADHAGPRRRHARGHPGRQSSATRRC